jgi:hypothetical protein
MTHTLYHSIEGFINFIVEVRSYSAYTLVCILSFCAHGLENVLGSIVFKFKVNITCRQLALVFEAVLMSSSAVD